MDNYLNYLGKKKENHAREILCKNKQRMRWSSSQVPDAKKDVLYLTMLMRSYVVSWIARPRFLMIPQPSPDQGLPADSSCKTKLNQERLQTHIHNYVLVPRSLVIAQQLSPILSRTLASDQFPLLNDPDKACIYLIKVKVHWNEKQIAQRTHKTSLHRQKYIYIRYLQGRSNIGFSFPQSGNLLYNKEKIKMKDCKNTSGEDVSFTSRISQSLTNSSQALRTAFASNERLCRSSLSKISQNSLELGPFSLQNLRACRASQKKCQTPFANMISGLNRWPCLCSFAQRRFGSLSAHKWILAQRTCFAQRMS